MGNEAKRLFDLTMYLFLSLCDFHVNFCILLQLTVRFVVSLPWFLSYIM